MTAALQTPIVFVVFNRPDTTKMVFSRIREVRPTKLLVIADGPRPHHPGDAELCAEVRKIATAIDWPCDLLTNFSEQNLGCHPRVVSGYDWAFSIVEEAILLEDDTLPDLSFFPFCEELLRRYRDDARIAAITGTNYVDRESSTTTTAADSYSFSLLGSLWGWATWRTRWQTYDRHLEHWPALRDSDALRRIFDERKAATWWRRVFDDCYGRGDQAAWDYRWTYTTLFSHRFSIVPRVNLISNLGFGEGATHTKSIDHRVIAKLDEMIFPLRHPFAMIWNRSFDRSFQRKKYPLFRQRLANKLKRTFAPIFGKRG